MDRAYRRLVLLLGLIICIPSVVNTHAMSTQQYAKLEYMLTQVAALEIDTTFNEPRQHTDRFRHLYSCIGQLIKCKLFNHIQVLDYNRYQQENFRIKPQGVTGYEVLLVALEDQKERPNRCEFVSNQGNDYTIDIRYNDEACISYDMDNKVISSQLFTSYKVILSKMNNKGISC